MKNISSSYYLNFKMVVFIISIIFVGYASAQTDKISNKSIQKLTELYEKKQQDAVQRFLKQGFKLIIESKNGDYSELVGENAIGKPLYLLTGNNNIVNGMKASVLQNGFDGFVMNGEGSRIALWENGQPRRAHEMFRTTIAPAQFVTRIEYATNQNQTVFRHATHIAGTIIGNQFLPSLTSPLNSLVRGVAFKSTIKAWDWLNVPSEMITAATTDNIKIANTSFGFNPLYLNASEFGRYNETSKQWDEIMCANKEFQIVKSVGNARDDFDTNNFPQYPQVNLLGGYDLLEGAGVSKNVLVVGSVNLKNATQINNSYNGSSNLALNGIGEKYSSWGPTDDGRIKPDFVAHGSYVLSSIDTQNNTYGYYNGTSQAAAGVTGGITLIQEYWKKKFINTMWSSTVRALLTHSVDEIDERGPDYRNGWGVVNIQKAATTIMNRGKSVIIREDILTNGQTIKFNIAATGKEDLKITIAWTDPHGNVFPIDPLNPDLSLNEVASKLINDLDIQLVRRDVTGLSIPLLDSSNNNVLLPWKIKSKIDGFSALDLTQVAIRGDNNRDNLEKIEVYKNLIPNGGGMFELQIRHKETLSSNCEFGQSYSLVISGVSFCEDNLVFMQNQDNELFDGVTTKVLANSIKASNVIKSVLPFQITNLDFVEYEAADFIEFLPQSQNNGTGTEGFTAEFGSDFYAHIDCTTNTNQQFAFSPRDIEAIVNDYKPDPKIEVLLGEMVIFPNPTIDGILNIQFSLIESSFLNLSVFDVSGKLIFKDESKEIYNPGLNKKTINLDMLPQGTYILYAKTKDNNRQIKFIKR